MATKDSIFLKTNSQLIDITFEEMGNSWYLNFSNDISFSLYTVWRLFDNDKVTLISNDHGHQFGLQSPVDLVVDLKKILDNKTLIEIQIEKNTGDLILTFDKNLRFVAYISSMGYESFQVFGDGKQFVAQGGGDIVTLQLK